MIYAMPLMLQKLSGNWGGSHRNHSRTGIRKTVQWYLDNLQWCRRVQDGSYQRERLGEAV